jgi:hypothetical protein
VRWKKERKRAKWINGLRAIIVVRVFALRYNLEIMTRDDGDYRFCLSSLIILTLDKKKL